jgi:hypothetical protein
MWLTWLFTVASLTTRHSAISALDRPEEAAADVLAARVAGLVVLGAMSVAYLSHAGRGTRHPAGPPAGLVRD